MKRYIATIAILLVTCGHVFATWSLIIIDPKTKEIGIAGASCTYNCYGIGKIIPNVGAIVVQAMSSNLARENGIQMILTEASPYQVIKAMRDSIFDPERQQYAVVTVRYMDTPGTYTGRLTKAFNGSLTDFGVSVQGNTLASDTTLAAVMAAVHKGKKDLLSVAEILMMALEAGSNAGGDIRCGDQRATSAFLLVAKPDDKKPYLNLQIFGQGKGKQNAVDLLRIKYQRWKRKSALR